MRIITFNVNGIRAAQNRGFVHWVEAAQPDVLALQEVKAKPTQVNVSVFEESGYQVFWNAAEKPGYSGTALLVRELGVRSVFPKKETLQTQGRCQILELKDFYLINVYVPAGGSVGADLAAKCAFYQALKEEVSIIIENKKPVLVCGDFNVARHAIDAPAMPGIEHVIGFLPMEREWLEDVLALGFVDAFRQINKEPFQFSWLGYNNYNTARGWRLDYVFVPTSFAKRITRAVILKNAIFSDHRPLLIELST